MAITIGVNSGFVTVSPTGDPATSAAGGSPLQYSTKDTSPSDANLNVTEIGFWRHDGGGTNSDVDWRVAIYSDDSTDEPNLLLEQSGTINAGSLVDEWYRVSVNIDINSSTVYWICVSLDSINSVFINFDTNNGVGRAFHTSVSSPPVFPGDWGTSTFKDSNGKAAIYALVEVPAGVTRKIKIAGTFQDKPIQTKVGGSFVDKPIKIKIGGTFQDA